MKDEIEQYSRIIKLDVDSNPLDWWKIHESTYLNLPKSNCVFMHLSVYLNGYLAFQDMLHLRKEVYLSQ